MKDPFNLRYEIEKEHSKRNTFRVARWVGSSKDRFAQLMLLFVTGDALIVQRAVWIMSCCVESDPSLAKPWLAKMMHMASRPDVHDAVRRNVVRTLQFVDIPRPLLGRAADLCFGFLRSVDAPVSVKAFSMTVLANIAAKEPDLKREISMIIEEMLPYGSAGIRSRGAKILSRLSALPK